MSTFTIPQDGFTQELQAIGRMIAKDQLRKAATALNVARQDRPGDARVFMMGMRLAQKSGNLPMAIKSAQQALALEPTWSVAMVELGHLLADSLQYDEAMKLARKAVANDPEDFQVVMHAAQIAEKCQADETVAWARKALQLSPGNAKLENVLASKLVQRGEWDEAVALYDGMLARDANDINGLLGRMSFHMERKEAEPTQRYADALLRLMPDDESVKYWHERAHGHTPDTQPARVIANRFDGMAQRFDLTLVKQLQYRLPEKVAKMLVELHPDRKFSLLDLGCGTGLLGVYLRRIQGHIIGVDLSHEMIRQAARHNVYSRFHTVNLVDALRETPADLYEVITCLDTLIYVGKLDAMIPDALRVLKPGGHFIFSCEVAEEDEDGDFVLRDTGRYAHKRSSVERLCKEAGFAYVHIEELNNLRLEGDVPQKGFLVVARKAVVS